MKPILRYLRQPRFAVLQILAIILLFFANIVTVQVQTINGQIVDQIRTGVPAAMDLRTQAALLVGLSFLFTLLQLVIANYLAEKIGYLLRNQVMQKVLSQTYSYILQSSPAQILTNLTSDVMHMKNFLLTGVTFIITGVVLLVLSLVAMFSLNAKLALVVSLTLPLVFVSFMVIFGKAGKLFQQGQEETDKINQAIDENIKASMLVRVSVTEEQEKKKFARTSESFKNVSNKIILVYALVFPIINAISYLASVLMLGIGGNQVIAGEFTLGGLFTFFNLMEIAIGQVVFLGFISTQIGQAVASGNRLEAVLAAPVTFANGSEQFTHFQSLELKNVSLTLPGANNDLLEDVNFTAKRGQKVGIIGTTGSGKSLLLQLFPRFLEPKEGKMKLNGKDIKDFDIQTWRQNLGIVFQENVLFSATVRENILLGRKGVSDAEIVHAAQIAEVDEFVQKMPGQYQELVGERGVTLSGGQKQRITIARSLLGKPEVLVLDDSTSKLDVETERRVLNNLKQALPDLTLIIVAQRISSVRDCDIIYLMDKGKIVAQGTHEELIASAPLYQEIDLSQSNIAQHD